MYLKALTVAVCAAIAGYLYMFGDDSDKYGSSTEDDVMTAWVNLIQLPGKKFEKVVVGVNSNVDLIVPGVELLKALGVTPNVAKNNDQIQTLSELQETFNHFFSKGAAAERAFMDENLYKKIIESAEKLPNIQFFIGGNAALMAAKISETFPEVKIQYVGPVGPKLKKLLPNTITIPQASHIPADEVHLIMEYQVGDQWGRSTAPVATRFITSFDESNSKMTMIETFFDNIEPYKPELVLLSGLHLLEGQSPEFFSSRLTIIQEGLQKLSPTLPVHLELASMANKQLVKEILEKVTPSISSLGLNEQELSFSSHAAQGPHGDLFHDSDGQPEIHKMSDIMLWLLQKYGYSKDNPKSKLTRVHFHSLTYHIIGVHPSAWGNIDSAVAAGTRRAGIQACKLDHQEPNTTMLQLKIPNKFKLYTGDVEREFNSSNPVLSWEKEGFHFAFSPVLVCKKPLLTVGLGDTISSTGLMYSQYMH